MSERKEKVRIKINGCLLETEPEKTILEAARENGFFIPSLCELEGLPAFAACRLCLVDVAGKPNWLPACKVRPEEGMEIITSTPELEELRKNILELILSEHPYFCLLCQERKSCEETKITISRALEPGGCIFCERNGNCELQKVVEYLKIKEVNYSFRDRGMLLWESDPFIRYNPNLCLLCGRCVRVCEEIRGEGVLNFAWRGSSMEISTAFSRSLRASGCTFCGACLDVCPVAAFSEKGSRPEGQLKSFNYLCSLCSSVCEMKAEIDEDGRLRRLFPSNDRQPAFLSGCARGRFGLRELLGEEELIFENHNEHGQQRTTGLIHLGLKIKERLKKLQPSEIAFIFDGRSSFEEIIYFLELAGRSGVENIFWFYPEDYLTRLGDFERGQGINFGRKIDGLKLSETNLFLVVESDLKTEALKLWLQLKGKLREGARLITLDCGFNSLGLFATCRLECRPETEYLSLLLLQKKILEKRTGLDFVQGSAIWREQLEKIPEEFLLDKTGLHPDEVEKTAELILENKPTMIFFGQRLVRQKSWSQNLLGLWNLAMAAGAEARPVTMRVNEILLEKIVARRWARASSDLSEISGKIEKGEIKAVIIQGHVPLAARPETMVILSPWATGLENEVDIIWPVDNIISQEGCFTDLFGNLKKIKRERKIATGSRRLLEIMFEGETFSGKADDIIEELVNELESEKKFISESPRYLNPEFTSQEFEFFTEDRTSEPDSDYFNIFLEPYLDHYSGKNMGVKGKVFRLIRNPEEIWMNPEDIRSLGLADENKAILEFDGEEIRMKLRKDWRVKKGTAVIRPDLNQKLWIERYRNGILKGRIKREV